MNRRQLEAVVVMGEMDAISYLRSPKAIRERCGQLFDLACANQLRYFYCDLNQLDAVADYVIQVIRTDYPDLNIPFHSRWRHFEVNGLSRLSDLETKLAGLTPLERAWSKFDLAITSVLLDAGAGADWTYIEPGTGDIYRRSEGLAVASFHLFCQGLFSSETSSPLQADAIALKNLLPQDLADGFQVSAENPLVGIQARAEILQRLGTTLQFHPTLFGVYKPRPGYLVNHLLNQAENHCLKASTVLEAVLEGFSDIWPERITLAGVNLGDVWLHPALLEPKNDGLNSTEYLHSSVPNIQSQALVPFHKLSQWLTYSLLEPLQELGLEITGLDALTGLPEYRNGGLCLDLGLLQIKDSVVLNQAHLPSSEVVVEWRALTVILLDRIAEAVRQRLDMDTADLPLVKVLQGGTWAAGRKIAAQKRVGGIPPIQVDSDGTVF